MRSPLTKAVPAILRSRLLTTTSWHVSPRAYANALSPPSANNAESDPKHLLIFFECLPFFCLGSGAWEGCARSPSRPHAFKCARMHGPRVTAPCPGWLSDSPNHTLRGKLRPR